MPKMNDTDFDCVEECFLGKDLARLNAFNKRWPRRVKFSDERPRRINKRTTRACERQSFIELGSATTRTYARRFKEAMNLNDRILGLKEETFRDWCSMSSAIRVTKTVRQLDEIMATIRECDPFPKEAPAPIEDATPAEVRDFLEKQNKAELDHVAPVTTLTYPGSTVRMPKYRITRRYRKAG